MFPIISNTVLCLWKTNFKGMVKLNIESKHRKMPYEVLCLKVSLNRQILLIIEYKMSNMSIGRIRYSQITSL